MRRAIASYIQDTEPDLAALASHQAEFCLGSGRMVINPEVTHQNDYTFYLGELQMNEYLQDWQQRQNDAVLVLSALGAISPSTTTEDKEAILKTALEKIRAVAETQKGIKSLLQSVAV